MKVKKKLAENLQNIKEKKPLLHHITNYVVMNETANATLCLGALPVMSHAKEEVEEMVSAASSLVLNIGTLTPELIDSMIAAGYRANKQKIPVVLDPVGVGATTLRTEATRRLIKEIKIDIIRGNLAEIGILSGAGGQIKGVESISNSADGQVIARELANKLDCVVAITGKQDVVSNGKQLALIDNGDAMLSLVTGTGCMATTIIAGFAAVNKDYFLATIGGLVAFGLAGEKAAKQAHAPGSYHVALYDALALLSPEELEKGAKVKIVR
jgi:hydroxyethylthiazole kinase